MREGSHKAVIEFTVWTGEMKTTCNVRIKIHWCFLWWPRRAFPPSASTAPVARLSRACRPPVARPSSASRAPVARLPRARRATGARQGPDRYQTFKNNYKYILLLKILKFMLDSEHAYASLARVMAAESVLTRTRKLCENFAM